MNNDTKHISCQYLLRYPLLWMTSLMRLGMDAINFLQLSGLVSLHQISFIASFNSSKLLHFLAATLHLMVCHKFSIGFKSGEFLGQSSNCIPFSWNHALHFFETWHGAESYWNIVHCNRCMQSINLSSKIFI